MCVIVCNVSVHMRACMHVECGCGCVRVFTWMHVCFTREHCPDQSECLEAPLQDSTGIAVIIQYHLHLSCKGGGKIYFLSLDSLK